MCAAGGLSRRLIGIHPDLSAMSKDWVFYVGDIVGRFVMVKNSSIPTENQRRAFERKSLLSHSKIPCSIFFSSPKQIAISILSKCLKRTFSPLMEVRITLEMLPAVSAFVQGIEKVLTAQSISSRPQDS
jgi:hypothetical protein